MDRLRDLTVLLLGLGDSGLAMARWCVRHGANVRVWDSREAPPQAEALSRHVPNAVWLRGPLVAEAVDGVGLVLKSPGLAPHDERIAPVLAAAAQRGVPVRGELDLFAAALRALRIQRGYAPKVLAITGTNGKTTTTAMTAMLVERAGLRVGLAGNIGPSLLQTLADALDGAGVAFELDAAAGSAEAPHPAAHSSANEMPRAAQDDAAGEAPSPEAAPDTSSEASADASADASTEASTKARDLSDIDPDVDTDAPLPAAADTASAEPAGTQPADDEVPVVPAIEPPAATTIDPAIAALPEAWVLELSSFQLDGATGFEPSAAAVLNLSEDHLDWHGDMAAYAAAKARIFGRDAVLVVNRDDPAVERLVPAPLTVKGTRGKVLRTLEREVVRFGLDAPRQPGDYGLAVENGMAWLVRARPLDELDRRSRRSSSAAVHELQFQRLMPADALRVRGRHNAANALAALALAGAIGCPLAPLLHALREYAGEPHRVELVASIDAIEAYDDSKGTNVGATVAALDCLGADKAPGKLVVILGGDGKGQDFAPLAEPVRRHARAVATIGRDAGVIETALAATGVPLERHATLEAATHWAWQQARAGDAVLLSPACASLDMFRNYAHRAEVFVAEVRAIAEARGQLL